VYNLIVNREFLKEHERVVREVVSNWNSLVTHGIDGLMRGVDRLAPHIRDVEAGLGEFTNYHYRRILRSGLIQLHEIPQDKYSLAT